MRGRRALNTDDRALIAKVVEEEEGLLARAKQDVDAPSKAAATAMRDGDSLAVARAMEALLSTRKKYEDGITASEERLYGRLSADLGADPALIEDLRQTRWRHRDREVAVEHPEAALQPSEILLELETSGVVRVADEHSAERHQFVAEHFRARHVASRTRVDRVMSVWASPAESPFDARHLAQLRAVCLAEDGLVGLNRELISQLCGVLSAADAATLRARYEDLACPRIQRDPLGVSKLLQSAAATRSETDLEASEKLKEIAEKYESAIRPLVQGLREEMSDEIREFSRQMYLDPDASVRRADRRQKLSRNLLGEASTVMAAAGALLRSSESGVDPTREWISLVRARADAIAKLSHSGVIPSALRD